MITPEEQKIMEWLETKKAKVGNEAVFSHLSVVRLIIQYRDYLAFTSSSEPVKAV